MDGPIITLTYRVAAERRAELMAFLKRAFPLYERPGGIRMELYESRDEAGLIVEIVRYASEADYERDQRRIEEDPEVCAALQEWRGLLAGPVEVRRLKPVSAPPLC